jgi:hypothetical protein
MKEVREIVIRIRPGEKIKGYSTVDIYMTVNGVEKELHELLKDSDIKSRFDEMIDIVKDAIKEEIREYELQEL